MVCPVLLYDLDLKCSHSRATTSKVLVRLGLHPIGFFADTTRENGGGDLESIPEITESTELDRRLGFTRIAKNGYEQTVTPTASVMVATPRGCRGARGMGGRRTSGRWGG